jgi:hypothetical protein
MGKRMTEYYDWSAEIAELVIPVLLVFADHDSVSLCFQLANPRPARTPRIYARLALTPGIGLSG